MKKVSIDKICSVTKNLALKNVETIQDKPGLHMPCTMGTVLAAEVLEDKSVYNEIELPSGRMSKIKKGDIIAVALGQRMALKGFVGRLPSSLRPGDVIHLLNFGGVAGECLSANVKEVGDPLRIRVLGAIVRKGEILNIGQKALFAPKKKMKSDIPLIITTGTSMDSGKTTVAIEVVKTLTRMGMKLAGAKLTGVAALRDLYKMQDYGVYNSVSFVDAGITSTANIPDEDMKDVVRGALDYLSDDEPDAIMIEFGDGLMGRYGVNAVLQMKEIQENVRLHIGCASDPVGAIGLARECKRIGIPIDVISGPVTDNQVGKTIVKEELGVLVYNAFNPTSEWIDVVISRWLRDSKLPLSA
ncbi:MAG: hypothetical protein H6858_01475 [Rhodospirillales bacterium]|nr:hypothetical protein [Alphaproteobacteria bacterium]MCB1839831.1 hypothetical protein [Alphaproteobacteria bacterium]MCB9976252.1 hypothetical protein [Rhodospirillales bacterium]